MQAEYMLTPSGRLVQGHPMETRTTDFNNRPLTDKNGQPRVEYFVAIAIRKDSQEWPGFLANLQRIAAAGFPGGEYSRADFSWKVKDGDHPDYAGRDGFAGRFILRCASGYPITSFPLDLQGVITDPNAIKRGDYIRLQVSIAPNGDRQKPGIYINPHKLQFLGHGDPIISGPTAQDVFGGVPVNMPAGASATPTFGGTPGFAAPVPQAAPAPQFAAPVQQAAPAPQFAAPVQQAAPAPAHDFLNPAGQA